MHFFPILSTLSRHRTAAALIVLEIALTCAIVSNAIFVIRERMQRMDRPSGIAEDEIVRVQLTGIGTTADAGSITAQDIAALKALPGVKHVAATNMIPFGNSSWNTGVTAIKDDTANSINAGFYLGTPELIDTLGVQLIAGRNFTRDDYIDFDAMQSGKADVASVIITKGLAERLYPGKNALGQPIYATGDKPQVVVGIVDTLARPNDNGRPKDADCAMVYPVTIPYTVGGNYLLRVDPDRADEVLGAAQATLDKVSKSRIVLERQKYIEIRREHFKQDRSMAWLLFVLSVSLLVITALGIVGLASFWVQQRTRQIGIRRALGATRGDILRYFQTENFILATLGIVLGMALAYGLNLWLMDKYQVARLPGSFLPIGALLLWCLGQIAVLGPALRATMIPPATATRSV
jgi:putative ABC transport system permease protein